MVLAPNCILLVPSESAPHSIGRASYAQSFVVMVMASCAAVEAAWQQLCHDQSTRRSKSEGAVGGMGVHCLEENEVGMGRYCGWVWLGARLVLCGKG